MRTKTKEHMNKVMTTIEEGIPMPAKKLAEKSRMSVGSIYKIIRMLREQGEPIMRTKTGYLHASAAEKRDDVYVMRMTLGRHASDVKMITNCSKYMKQRWRGVEEKKQLLLALNPLTPSTTSIFSGLRMLQDKSQSLGI